MICVHWTTMMRINGINLRAHIHIALFIDTIIVRFYLMFGWFFSAKKWDGNYMMTLYIFIYVDSIDIDLLIFIIIKKIEKKYKI